MHLIEALAAVFIKTFGITQPTDKARRLATYFIVGLLSFVVAGLAMGALVVLHLLR